MGLGDRDYYRPSGFGGFSLFPPVIKKLLIINAVVFFIQILNQTITFGGIPGEFYIFKYFALVPLGGVNLGGFTMDFLPWQLITYQFLHGDFWHIAMNMFILWMFGMEIENYWGSSKFLFFYLAAGITGGILQLITTTSAYTIGASGAVYGVMVAFAMFFPDRYIFLYMLVPVKAKYLIVFVMVIEFLSVGNMSVVAHLVHIGGAAFAFGFILLDRKYHFNVEKWFSKLKQKTPNFERKEKYDFKTPFRKPFGKKDDDVQEAKFYEINNSKKDPNEIDQDEIDRILDKISQSGYQNLSDKEKKILFEASKKK
jgi:membrane associated rhomboid family serine protease